MHLSVLKSVWGNPSTLPLPMIFIFFLILVTLFIYLFIYLNYQQNKLPWVDKIYKIFTFLNKQYFYKTKYN